MLGKLQRSPFPKGSLRGGQNRTGQFSLYQTRLDTLVNMNHPLSILSTELDWPAIVQRFIPLRRSPLDKASLWHWSIPSGENQSTPPGNRLLGNSIVPLMA